MICTLHQYCSSAKIAKNEMGGACNAIGKMRAVYRVLVGEREEKRPIEKPRHRWENNNKMHRKELGCGGTDWIELAQGRDSWFHIMRGIS